MNVIMEKLATYASAGIEKDAVSIQGIRNALAGSLRGLRRAGQAAGSIKTPNMKNAIQAKYTQAGKLTDRLNNRALKWSGAAGQVSKIPQVGTAANMDAVRLGGEADKFISARFMNAPLRPGSGFGRNIGRNIGMSPSATSRNMNIPPTSIILKKYPSLSRNFTSWDKYFYDMAPNA